MTDFETEAFEEESESLKKTSQLMKDSTGDTADNAAPVQVVNEETHAEIQREETEEEKAFNAVWGEINAETLHKKALHIDLKKEVTHKDGDSAEDTGKQEGLGSKLSQMSLFNSGRTEKSRRNHLSDAAKGFEEVSASLKAIKEEKEKIAAEHGNATTEEEKKALSKRIMDNVAQSEAAINLLFESKVHRYKGVRDSSNDSENKAKLKDERLKMLLNLYREEMKNPMLLPKDKENLTKKALKLNIYKDITANRLALVGQNLADLYVQYPELDGAEVFRQSQENTYNTDAAKRQRLYGLFADSICRPGCAYGYISTKHSMFMNKYLRLLQLKNFAEGQRSTDPEGAESMLKTINAEIKQLVKDVFEREKMLDDVTDFHGMSESQFEVHWLKEIKKTVKEMDLATKGNTLVEKTKLYRMVGDDILNWGFGLKGEDVLNSDPETLTEKLNKQTGTEFMEPGYMSTGWAVDTHFADRPIMLTILADEGQKCFVTKNFAEGEVIFGRGTRYIFVAAVNHEEEVKKAPTTPEWLSEDADDAGYVTTGSNTAFRGIELIVKIVKD